ncbi:UNVERIFIED_CONTAM: hypothetical protein Sradi_3774100 [Sesamum radiatum]|uniref:Reverse transcriptase zinc-binding domain-containing protein n=1 Tax=Sesamum radiatum TaxID=300843 RepID=A0AAW2PZD8_SESRA
MKISELDMPSSSGSSGLTADWSFVWKCSFPNKIKVFGWKSCRNALATLSNLARRCVDVENCFPLCSHQKEDLQHILLYCQFARQVWALSLLPTHTIGAFTGDIEGWFRHVCASLEPLCADRFFVLCWSLWNNRNKKLMEDKNQSAIDVINLADRLLREFAETSQSLAPRGSATRSLQNWQPPTYGIVKINFDGAVFDSRIEMGAGVIARDAAGECLAWRTRNFRFAANPSLAESLATREAIDLGLKRAESYYSGG